MQFLPPRTASSILFRPLYRSIGFLSFDIKGGVRNRNELQVFSRREEDEEEEDQWQRR